MHCTPEVFGWLNRVHHKQSLDTKTQGAPSIVSLTLGFTSDPKILALTVALNPSSQNALEHSHICLRACGDGCM